MEKIIKALIVLLVGALIVLGAFAYTQIWSPMDSSHNEEIVVDVKPKTTLKGLLRQLEDQGLISNSTLFYYYLRIFHKGDLIKAGEYSVTKAMPPVEIWRVISSGHSKNRIFSVPEGFNSFEISQLFERGGFGLSQDFLKIVFDRKLAVQWTGVEAISLEGFLFPDTYKVNKYIGAKELINLMVKKSLKVIAEVRNEIPSQTPTYKMVTIASIVEKETGNPDERSRISSVIHNRLAKGMKLQMDPTVIYGYWRKTGKYIQNIRRKDLLEPNEFNTYTFYGLPAGPICNPGRSSLIAALRPERSGYLYFVSRNDGTHVFTDNLKDHNKAVAQFQMDQRNRKGKSWRDLNKKKPRKKNNSRRR